MYGFWVWAGLPSPPLGPSSPTSSTAVTLVINHYLLIFLTANYVVVIHAFVFYPSLDFSVQTLALSLGQNPTEKRALPPIYTNMLFHV